MDSVFGRAQKRRNARGHAVEGAEGGIPPGHQRLLILHPTSRGRGPAAARMSVTLLLPRLSLHMRCAGATFDGSVTDPPREAGTISSTSKLIGWPAGSE